MGLFLVCVCVLCLFIWDFCVCLVWFIWGFVCLVLFVVLLAGFFVCLHFI